MPKILLLVVDEPGRHLLDALLSLNGYDVILADSVQEGVEIFRQGYPDVLVLDLDMPEMNGAKVVRQIRRINPCQPMICLIGNRMSKQRLDALGVNEVIKKDLAAHRLLSVLRRLLTATIFKRTSTQQINYGKWRAIS